MDKFLIRGGKRLSGKVNISGSKNASLPLMAATLLCPSRHSIKGVPDLRDIRTMSRLLHTLGAEISFDKNLLHIDSSNISLFEAPYELVKTMRASVLVLGPLLARYGRAKVSLPGGCAIGSRPINLHIEGLKQMGAEIVLEQGYIIASTRGRLRGAKIYFDIPTVTGTENVLMAASLADGVTVIENAAKEPEVVDLANALSAMGAKIKGAGTEMIEVEGVTELKPLNEYTVIPDRIEAATFLCIAGITGSEITIDNVIPEHLDAVIAKLRETDLQIDIHNSCSIKAKGQEIIRPANIKTMPYPGFPTDVQAQFMALMSVAQGTSIIRETIFENRFMHVGELRRMGADIITEGSVATVKGVKELRGAPVMSSDLRASASLVVAGLRAKGETVIDRVYHLDRGYERMELKLQALGADIERIRS
ncbi:MAG: UDP-N-acetylglucosamine 1-carboxyvinyltransferase [Thermodesulfovibrionales bacterium]|nr:UDP-N-acetylglucosamine 1-carboxyvinyltransferase [Thermodesulfovibrionales bacterium]